MLNSKEIEKAAIALDEPPDSYSNIEIHLFFVFQDLLGRYKTGRLSKDQASRIKNKAIVNYERTCKDYERYKYYNDLIDKTQLLRIELRKNPKIETALELIECYSGEVGTWNLDHIKKKFLT